MMKHQHLSVGSISLHYFLPQGIKQEEQNCQKQHIKLMFMHQLISGPSSVLLINITRHWPKHMCYPKWKWNLSCYCGLHVSHHYPPVISHLSIMTICFDKMKHQHLSVGSSSLHYLLPQGIKQKEQSCHRQHIKLMSLQQLIWGSSKAVLLVS